ncbi:MAG: hypothetical protein CME70_13715 [Halobacteriovorax sp.]|nr:hypothetical protein [Halobacteriovorax sp.]
MAKRMNEQVWIDLVRKQEQIFFDAEHLDTQLELFDTDTLRSDNGKQTSVSVLTGEVTTYTVLKPNYQAIINAMMHSAKFMDAEEWIDSPESQLLEEARRAQELEKNN